MLQTLINRVKVLSYDHEIATLLTSNGIEASKDLKYHYIGALREKFID